MARLIFDFQPEGIEGLREPAEVATWGRLEIRVESGGRKDILTRVLDTRANTTRTGVYGTVLPLAEWFARAYFAIFEGLRLPPSDSAPRADRYRWRRAHCLRFAGEGTAVPDLCLWNTGDGQMSLQWFRDREDSAPWEPVMFLSQGAATLPRDQVREAVIGLVDQVIRRCADHGDVRADDPRYVDLVEAQRMVLDPGAPDRQAALLAGRMGDLYEHVEESTKHELGRLVAEGEDALLDTLVDLGEVLRPEAVLESAGYLEKLFAQNDTAVDEWRHLRQELRAASEGPLWTRGWRDAESLRALLGHGQSDRLDPVKLPSEPRFTQTDLAGLLRARDAVIGWLPGRSPSSVGTSGNDFQRLRNAWPALYAGSPDQACSFALSPRIAGLTSVANAFAAELIAPHRAIEYELGGRTTVDGDDIAQIASTLDAPWSCVRHQVENRSLARIELWG